MSPEEPPPEARPPALERRDRHARRLAEVERERREDELRRRSSSSASGSGGPKPRRSAGLEERYVEDNIDDPIAFPPIAGFRQSQIRSS